MELFKKYNVLLSSLAKHQVFRDYLGHNTLKLPRGVFPIPNGYVRRVGDNLYTLKVVPIDIYGNKIQAALRTLNLAAGYLSHIKEAERLVLGQLGLISSREFLPLLLKLPHFDSFTGSPNTGGGVTTCKNCYASTADSDWAVNHDASSGTVEIGSVNTVYLSASGTTNKWSLLIRNFHSYDLTVMGAGADVSGSPTIGLYVTGKTETLGSQSYNIYNSTAASASDVAAEDFDQAGTTAQATALTGAGITTTAVNDWTLNATGIATLEAAAGGAVKFSVRLVSDAANAEPTWGDAQVARIGFEMAADTNPPLLTATYTPIATSNTFAYFL